MKLNRQLVSNRCRRADRLSEMPETIAQSTVAESGAFEVTITKNRGQLQLLFRCRNLTRKDGLHTAQKLFLRSDHDSFR